MADEYTAGMWIDTNIDNGVGNQILEFFDCCSGSGSIGCFALNSDGNPVLLSCQHVLFPDDHAPANALTFQPRFSSCCSGDQIATQWTDPAQFKNGRYLGGYMAPPADATVLVKYHGVTTQPGNVPNGFMPTVTDCAMALLTKAGLKFRNVWKYTEDGQVKEVPLKGFYAGDDLGVVKGPSLGTLPAAGAYVRAYSERLGRVVYGTVLGLPGSPADPPPPGDPQRLLYPNGIGDPDKAPSICRQLMFLPRPDPNPSKTTVEEAYDSWGGKGPDHGDSGTMVINADNMIVGMIAAQVKPAEIFGEANLGATELRDVGNIALFTPIRDIVTLLKVTIPASPNPWASSVPSHGARVFAMPGRELEETARQRGLARMREGLRRSRRGRLMLGLINLHGRELRFMFQRVRALAVAWQHLKGPAFMHHGVRSLSEPGHIVPHAIDGVSRRELMEALLPIIEQHASPRLKKDLRRHRAWAEHVVLSVHTLDEVIDAASVSRSAV
jgi:hypothetical protein